MTAYYSLNEIKGLPGLPLADRALRALAATWESRPRAGKGGGIEYSSESLPAAARAAIEQRNAYKLIPFDLHAEYGSATPDIRPDAARADSKAWYLSALDGFQKIHQLTVTKAREYFTLAVRLGLIKIPAVVSAVVSKISVTTLRRWEQVFKIAGLDKLNGLWKGRKSILDLDAIDVEFKKLLIYSTKRIEEELRKKFSGTHKIPSIRAIGNHKRKIQRENPREFIRTVEGEDAYRNKYGKGKEGSLSENILKPNAQWMMDSTKTDILLADGTRYWIIGAIDVYSRRVVLSLHKQNNAKAVTNGLLHKALATFGIPDEIKIDNGTEYVNNHFEDACRSLEIDLHRCNPGNPMEKGNIERFFGTLTKDFERGLPGYVGSNIFERKAFDNIVGSLTPEQFQIKLDQYAAYYNERREHSSIGCTPMEKWAEGVKNGAVIRKVANPRLLDFLLLESVKGRTRKVGAEGIQVGGHWYASESLAYEQLKGQDILVKYNPVDMGDIYCYDLRGEYKFIAYCPELKGISRAELVAKLKLHRKTAKKYEQATLDFFEINQAETHAQLVTFQKEQPAHLPAIEQAQRLHDEVAAIQAQTSAPISLPLEITQDAIELDATPLDPLDRYRWYRNRIHTGECASSSGVLDFLRSIESKPQNWSVVIESDLRWVTPSELWDGRPVEYIWELEKAATILKPKHESMPWRAYQSCYSMSDLTPEQRCFMSDFESHPDNQNIIPILQHFKIYRADILNKALIDNPLVTPDNWRFEAGYFQRYYQYPERDLLHIVPGKEPIKNPNYDWANHQSIVQARKQAC